MQQMDGDGTWLLRQDHIVEARTMYEQLESDLYAPTLGSDLHRNIGDMVESPMMQFLMASTLNAWTLDEENWMTAWHSPDYIRLALTQNLAMSGVSSIQKAANVSQSQGWAVTSMLARGVCIARLSYFALACGSLSDAVSNYRMLLERLLLLRYLDSNDHYDAFAKAFYAEIYRRASQGVSDQQLRNEYDQEQIDNCKHTMALIRAEYLDGKQPRAPGHYWRRPESNALATQYVNAGGPLSESAQGKMILRVYELGNQAVHPRLRDMAQPEDSDLSYEDMLSIVLVTLAELTEFGLSLFEETYALAGRVQEIIIQPVHAEASLMEVVKASEVANQQAIEIARRASPD